MADTLVLRNIGPIREARITFADLTVLVGPQASGKSIALQWLRLLLDTGSIQEQLTRYGLDWDKDLEKFLGLYFGEGMQETWSAKSRVIWCGKPIDVRHRVGRIARGKAESAFLIPAQRVLTLSQYGWPRPFSDYSPGDPFAVRSFSERLRILLASGLGKAASIFPKANILKEEYRRELGASVFGGFRLAVDSFHAQQRLVLSRKSAHARLPYMVWSAGQREFVPLLLGLYWLLPGAGAARRDDLKWAVIEEIESGLHPKAITTALLLVLELLSRGYKVCLSTHSPQVLDMVWALRALAVAGSDSDEVLQLLGVESTQALRRVANAALRKVSRVYYFDTNTRETTEISDLDPGSTTAAEANWGGLLEFSERANQTVASAAANSWNGDDE